MPHRNIRSARIFSINMLRARARAARNTFLTNKKGGIKMKKGYWAQNGRLTIQAWVGLLCVVALGLWPPPLLSQVPDTPDTLTETPALHTLSNEDLLSQAQSTYQQASEAFLAQSRGLAKSEALLSQAQQKIAAFKIPPNTPPRASLPAADAAKLEADQTQARLAAFTQRLSLSEGEQQLWQRHIEQTETTHAAAQALVDAIDGLELFLLEIRLRVEDGTLARNAVPATLNEQRLRTQARDISRQQTALKQHADEAYTALEEKATRLNEEKQAVIEAEAASAAAQKKYAQELKRQTLEQEYAGQTSQQLLAELTTLQDELVGLNGAFRISQSRFSDRQTQAAEVQTALDALVAPETPLVQSGAVVQSAEVEQVSKQVDELVAHHSTQIEQSRALDTTLAGVMTEGQVFQGDATVLSEHLFRMQLPASALERMASEGLITLETIPEDSRPEALRTTSDTVASALADAQSAIQSAKERREQIVQQIENSQTSQQEAQDRLAQLKQSAVAAERARQWDTELKDLEAQALVQRFTDNTEKSQTTGTSLEEARQTYTASQTAAEKIQNQLDSLTDPLLRVAQEESQEEKQTILKRLYGLAGLEVPTEVQTAAPSEETAAQPTDQNAALAAQIEQAVLQRLSGVIGLEGQTNGQNAEQEAEAASQPAEDTDPIVTTLTEYQATLSKRSRIIEERQALQTELQTALTTLHKHGEQYATVLSEATTLALQNYATAVELKKRIGQQQLQGSAIPDGITEALQQERVAELETELAELLGNQTLTQQRIDVLSQPDETLPKRQALLTQILDSIGTRLDVRTDLAELEAAFTQSRDGLSEVARQSLEQDAQRRLNESGGGFGLAFAPSERADNLTSILQAYYADLIELEAQQANLQQQAERTERLVQLADGEKTTVAELLPFLQQQADQLEAGREEEDVKIQAQLQPEEAEQLLAKFEAKTGRRLPTPPPVAEEDKAEAIAQAATVLFDRQTQIVAAKKWIDLLQNRLSAAGLGAETGHYQDELGGLEAQAAGVQRQVSNLTGRPESALAELAPEEQPQTDIDKLRFVAGEIGVVEADRDGCDPQK